MAERSGPLSPSWAPPFEIRMALRYLALGRRGGLVAAVTSLCVVGVTVGVAALVVGLALMTGIQGHVKDRLLAANPQVLIRMAKGEPMPVSVAQAVMAEGLEHPEVEAAAPYFEIHGLLQSRSAEQPVLLKGVVPSQEDRVTGLASATLSRSWEQLEAGLESWTEAPAASEEEEGDEPFSMEELEPPPAPPLLLGHLLALDLNVVAGDLVHLVTAEPQLFATGALPKSRAFEVVGLLTTGVSEYDASLALVPLTSVRMGDGTPRVDGIEFALESPLESVRVAAELAEALPRDYFVTDWTTVFSRLFAAFEWERLIMVLAIGLIGLVAGFNLFTILSMNVLARVSDIGVLSALGAPASVIGRLFTWMGLGIGAAGTVAGLALGTVFSVTMDHFRLLTLDESVYLVPYVPFEVMPSDLLAVAASMLVLSFLSTLIPARSAARVDPIAALRAD